MDRRGRASCRTRCGRALEAWRGRLRAARDRRRARRAVARAMRRRSRRGWWWAPTARTRSCAARPASPAAERDYGQAAVVANFRCEKPHRNVAFQWFQGGPVLALLPLPGDQVSMVWSLPAAEAQRVCGLDPRYSCREVAQAAHGRARRAGGWRRRRAAIRCAAFRPASWSRRASRWSAMPAHVIHPLAGQGLNLGLQDARALAQTTRASREPGRDPGDCGCCVAMSGSAPSLCWRWMR